MSHADEAEHDGNSCPIAMGAGAEQGVESNSDTANGIAMWSSQDIAAVKTEILQGRPLAVLGVRVVQELVPYRHLHDRTAAEDGGGRLGVSIRGAQR